MAKPARTSFPLPRYSAVDLFEVKNQRAPDFADSAEVHAIQIGVDPWASDYVACYGIQVATERAEFERVHGFPRSGSC